MGIYTKTTARLVASALLAFPMVAGAAGLGKLTVLSGLGQPLHAEIELVTGANEDPSNFIIRMASQDAYRDARIDFPSQLAGARFTIERRSNGSSYVRMVTGQPVNEPFVDVLVELSWSSGKVVKEFTALLDPADYKMTAKPTGNAPTVNLPTTKGSKGSKKQNFRSSIPLDQQLLANGQPAADKPAKPAKPAKTEPAAEPASGDYTVKRGDTLASIAGRNKYDDVSLEQMLVGLYQANPDAFERNNMNRMKVGSIIKVPDQAAVQAISQTEARKEIRLHASNWSGYRQQVASNAAQQPASGSSESGQSSSGKIETKVVDKGAAAANGDKGTVKVTQGQIGKASANSDATSNKAAKDKVQALEAEALARDKKLKELQDRVAEQEALNKKLSDLLKLKDAEMKRLQDQAKAGQSGKPTEPVKPAEPTKPAEPVKPAEPTKPAVASEPLPVAAASAAPVASAAVETASSEAKPQVASAEQEASKPAAKPRRVAPVQEAPAPEPEWTDVVMENLPIIGGAVGAVALIGGLLVMRRRRRGRFDDSIITGSDLRANTNIGNTGGAIINTGATENSFLTDFSREGLGQIDTDEVDPIAEAEVYLAYGRDPQAEEILRDALHKDGTRHEVRVKLMEIYANRKDVTAFNAQAAELHKHTQGMGPQWSKAAEMGRQVDPQNPLYGGSQQEAMSKTASMPAVEAAAPVAAAAAAAPAATDLDFDLGLPGDEPAAASAPAMDQTQKLDLDFDLGTPAEAAVTAEPEAAADETPVLLDFDLGDMNLSAPDAPAASAAEEAPSLDLDMSLDMPELEMDAPAAAPAAEAAADEAAMLDFNFDLDAPKAAAPSAAPAADDGLDMDLGDISLDLGESSAGEVGEFSMDEGDDPVATKLDLAKAYIEMGDQEGAREILGEVEQEGSGEQQSEARRLLDQLK
ncbi:FimV/HubP family polar landmark protein [Leeia aquatica]|uniref:FimV family protein n=1 Tax=Leeia aquatica TaxID=2725557 RepID=A0A847S2G8_9NEIS|nr:FimV/HubP family polar landmark protein [Leeia aquatica]NLR73973.1 FimV family protein [Leeia aquatica]